jgi:predicted naringenin-chalcone synthase
MGTPKPVYIHNIHTAVPETAYSQADAGEVMLREVDPESRGGRLMRRIYRDSGIDKRHSVIRDLKGAETNTQIDSKSDQANTFFDATDGRFKSPSTGARNAIYAREARVLFSATARGALDGCPQFNADQVTHVITVSCTGFFAPGPDFYVVKDLGLSPSVERFHVGFMGCYAAFPAMKMAKAFCASDENAVVLIVCLELCSLHIEPSEEIDAILACSVFADGAGAMIVSSKKPPGPGAIRMDHFNSVITPDSEGDMAWTIGDKGFDMVLSTYVPKILEANTAHIVDDVLRRAGMNRSDINCWAVHPGGRAILDKIQKGLALQTDALNASRSVLRDYGNMSSATILFVLDRMRKLETTPNNAAVFAMAFGPGLTVETAVLSIL